MKKEVMESLLKSYEDECNETLKGTLFVSRRNPTLTEKCVNVTYNNEANRMASIWPKDGERVEVILNLPLYSVCKAKMELELIRVKGNQYYVSMTHSDFKKLLEVFKTF